ncbi:RNA 2',3'-cyclic phosphodiesterase [Propionivibrio sp.]|uniref:RNA 2',3'-cyclic phosphodiesterase n=1 Tax=Propionivibrio sp. TaxID=2212460 RepID=UPI003BF1F8F5
MMWERPEFFALCPDEPCADLLHALAESLAASLGGKATLKETLHLTLAFVGNVNENKLPDLLEMASEVAEEIKRMKPDPLKAGSLLLDRLACWKHNRILWIGSDHFPSVPEALAEHLAGKLRARGYILSERPFAPHITLVRKLKAVPEAAELDALKIGAIQWPYNAFVLLRSRLSSLGPAYERLGTWELEKNSN